MRWLAAVLVVAAIAPIQASAGELVVEGPGRQRRGEVRDDVAAMWDMGLDAEILKLDGSAGRFAARSAPFDALDDARLAAGALANRVGGDVSVLDVAETGATVVFSAAPGEAADGPVDPVAVAALLERAMASAGGADGVAEQLAGASSVVFSFTRVTPELSAGHRYTRDGGDRRLVIDVSEGDGVSSDARVEGDEASLAVGGAAPTPQDAVRTRELADEFAPASVYGLAARIGPTLADLLAAGAPEDYRLEVVDGVPCHVVRYAEAATTIHEVALSVSSMDVLRIRVASRGSDLTQAFRGWSDVSGLGGVRLPRQVVTSREGRELLVIDVTELVVTP